MNSYDYTDKYYSRFLKKIEGKPAPVRLIMERTFHSAVWVLETIDGLNASEIKSATNLFVSKLKNREFALIYRAQLEIAWNDADSFLFGLHSFYNNLAIKIKKEHKERAIADFISEVMRYHVGNNLSAYNKAATAYINMMLQTMEYLRPEKFNFEKSIYGIDNEGKFLLGPCPFPYSDVPMTKLNKMMLKRQKAPSREELNSYLMKEYQAQGIEVSSFEDFTKFERAQRIHVTTIASMLSLITEDTYDILPEKSYYAEENPVRDLLVPFKSDKLCEMLKTKPQGISKSGITIFFGDPECLLEYLVLKEICRGSKSYVLYRLRTAYGDLSGYYDLEDTYFYSIFGESEDKYNYEVVKTLVLVLYASQVFSELFSLDEILMRASGPIPIGVLDKEPEPIGEKSIDEQMITVQFNKDDLGEEDSVIRERYIQGMAIKRAEKVLDNARGKHLDVLCPFTWYCLTRTKNYSLE